MRHRSTYILRAANAPRFAPARHWKEAKSPPAQPGDDWLPWRLRSATHADVSREAVQTLGGARGEPGEVWKEVIVAMV